MRPHTQSRKKASPKEGSNPPADLNFVSSQSEFNSFIQHRLGEAGIFSIRRGFHFDLNRPSSHHLHRIPKLTRLLSNGRPDERKEDEKHNSPDHSLFLLLARIRFQGNTSDSRDDHRGSAHGKVLRRGARPCAKNPGAERGAGPCLSAQVVRDESCLFVGPDHDSLLFAGCCIQQAIRRRATRLTSGGSCTTASPTAQCILRVWQTGTYSRVLFESRRTAYLSLLKTSRTLNTASLPLRAGRRAEPYGKDWRQWWGTAAR